MHTPRERKYEIEKRKRGSIGDKLALRWSQKEAQRQRASVKRAPSGVVQCSCPEQDKHKRAVEVERPKRSAKETPRVKG